MKNILNKYVNLSLFLALSLIISSCSDENLGEDASKVIPLIYNFEGPTLSFQNATASYSVMGRGGSDYVWTASNGAEIQPVEGFKFMVNVTFKNSGLVTLSVYEKAFNGLSSELKTVDVEVACNPQSGVWRVEMHDIYGDGWQTNDGTKKGISINVDGAVQEIGLCSAYGGNAFPCPAGSNDFDNTAYVTIPSGSISAQWMYHGDEWGENSFEIYAPDGSLAFDSGGAGNTKTGQLPIVVCN